MPDEMDVIQERVQRDIDALVARRVPAGNGRRQCARAECKEPIRAERTALGAQFCLECQREIDANAASLGGRRRR